MNLDYGDELSIRTVGDLMYAVSRAQTQEDRLAIYMRAAYAGLAHRLPSDWNPNGTLKITEVN